MARIPLTSGFTVCPEGTYVLTCENVEYKEEFGTLNLTFRTDKGNTHRESYFLLDQNGQPNERAMNAFSFLAKNLLNDFEAADVDPQDLVGRAVNATITHTQSESKKNPGKLMTYAHIGDVSPVTANLDLGSILG